MNYAQASAAAAEKISVEFPQTNLEYKPKPLQAGNETVNRTTQWTDTPTPKPIGWCKDSQRNKPQSNSLGAASLIFTSGGMCLALSVGFGSLNLFGTHTQYCWFIAVIIGACISTLFVHKVTKRMFNVIASVLIIIDGVLNFVATQGTIPIVLSRYCNGIAYGLTLIPAILAGSEESVKRFRGLVLSIEQISLSTGAMLVIVFTQSFQAFIFGISYMHGTLSLIYGFLALLFTYFLTIESPVFLLRQNNEIGAIDVLRRLQRPKTITNETYSLLNECKALLAEDEIRGKAQNISNSWIPMLKLILFRCFVSMSFSFPLTMIFLATYTSSSGNVYFIGYFGYLYAMMRMLGVCVAIFVLDNAGRRIPSALSILVGGGVLLAVRFLTSTNGVTGLMFLYQFLSGIMAPASTCYLSEGFSVSVKPYFILAAITCENILQILLCCLININNILDFIGVLGGLQVLYGIAFLFTMPETKQTTLREALKLFQTMLVVRTRPGVA